MICAALYFNPFPETSRLYTVFVPTRVRAWPMKYMEGIDYTGSRWNMSEKLTAGLSISLTGTFARFGLQASQAIQLWAESTNAHLRYYDDESRAALAVEHSRRLLARDGVNILFGPYSSGLVRAVAKDSPATHPFFDSAAPSRRTAESVRQGLPGAAGQASEPIGKTKIEEHNCI